MVLPEDQQKQLGERYDRWGIDAVRRELRRPGRDLVADREVTNFAYRWIERKEGKRERRSISGGLLVKVLMVAAVVECAVVLNLA